MKTATDWTTVERIAGNTIQARLKATLPAEWVPYVDTIRHTATAGQRGPFARESAWHEALRAFEEKHARALRWHLGDEAVCSMARACADDVADMLRLSLPGGAGIADQLQVVLDCCDAVGVEPPRSITGEGAIRRGRDPIWWRRTLRKAVAREVEAESIRLGVVNRKEGGYASNQAVARRGAQLARNAENLARTLMRNEAGQVYTLAELAAVGVSNPVNRGGELMTRIRGCEEWATERGHVGIFCTLTAPSAFHAVTHSSATSAGRPRPNKRYDGHSTPRDAQQWLCKQWARARAALARRGLSVYGFRVAEPHHDGTPHWHALVWAENDAAALQVQALLWFYWVKEFGDEPGAEDVRCNFKRMEKGGAAGYIAKYIAKSIGHHALPDSQDERGAEMFTVETGDVPGWKRVDAWAATWGIRQFQAIGQPSVSVWRELRRVSADQVEMRRVGRQIEFDKGLWQTWRAVHRDGDQLASWAGYMRGQGGPCQRRGAYRLGIAVRQQASVNRYGEAQDKKTVVGVALSSGRWLVSRRIAWARVALAQRDSAAQRTAKPDAWTGFNNCTARLTGRLRAALLTVQPGALGALRLAEKRRAGVRTP